MNVYYIYIYFSINQFSRLVQKGANPIYFEIATCKNPLYFNCIYYRKLTMDNQSGGVKRKADDMDSPGFTRIYNMVNAANSKLDVLNTGSLKGFMSNLTVDKEDSEYLNLRGKRFTEPVTNFILKFVILTDIPGRDLGYYNGKHKSSESRESFFNEAKLQQHIWKTSIAAGRPAICPSVANLSMFTTN